jgi:ribose-phosphate pyrophosphokinase
VERAPLEIYTNRSGAALAEKICAELRGSLKRKAELKHILVRDKVEQFPCGEFKVTLEKSVRGKDIFLVQCPIDPGESSRSIQDNVWEMLQALETLRFCHAQHVTLVVPCLPYSRQDKRAGRESCSALLIAKMIAKAGAEALITIDLHANQIKGFYEALDVRPDALYATNIFIEYLKEKHDLNNLVILAPDEGSAKRARLYATKLFEEEAKIEERSSTQSRSATMKGQHCKKSHNPWRCEG